MRQRCQARPAWALWLLVGLGGLEPRRTTTTDAPSPTARWTGPAGVAGQITGEVTPRWGQASALLSPNNAPTLLVVSGKTPVSGQTVDSTPATSSALSLDLSEPISDLARPPWTPFPSSGSAPIAANGALVPFSSTSALFFGGDASSDPAIALPTGNDSSWLLSFPTSPITAIPTVSPWTHETLSEWTTQPQRRESVYAVSASNGTISRSWIYGGLRPDGSGTAYSELWEVQATLDLQGRVATTPVWGRWREGGGGPPAMYDGTAVLLPASSDSPTALPSIYLIGGVESAIGGATILSDLSTAWVFEPTDRLASGRWQKIKLANAPPNRRGHVAVTFGTGAIWIQGGRSLDGSTVYSDAAVLDIRGRRWSTAAKGQAVWGHSAAAVGETILLAFGYGRNGPASPSMSVYAPGNDTWLDAYQPSYLVAVGNPKAASTPASTTATSSEIAPVAVASSGAATAGIDQPDDATGGLPTKVVPTTTAALVPHWTAPGVALPTAVPTEPPSGSGESTSSEGSGGNGDKTPASVIAGAVVGSILGALVLGIGGIVAVKRHRDQRVYSRRAYTGDGDDYGPGASTHGGLMADHQSGGGFASSEAYNAGTPLPAIRNPRTLAGVGGGLGAMAALLSPRKRNPAPESPARGRRFNMLDEEEGVDESWTDVGWPTRSQGWTRFDGDEDQEDATHSTPPLRQVGVLSLTGRGGMGVWDGFGGISRIGDSIRSSKSFLGGALGGFVGVAAADPAATRAPLDDRADDKEKQEEVGTTYGDGDEKAASRRHEYGSLVAPPLESHEDPALTPIAEWEEEEAPHCGVSGVGAEGPRSTNSSGGDACSVLSHTAASSESHQTRSTRPTSTEVSPTKVARIARPFSPDSASNVSLYGSRFAAPPRFATPEADLSRALSSTSHVTSHSHRVLTRSNSSWWSRLNLQKGHQHGAVPTPTASEAIRDPAPAPTMDAIAETDPFLDPPVPDEMRQAAPSRHDSSQRGKADELGRFATATERFAHGVHDRSASSNTSEATATSSVLEDRLRNMDVVQRVQSGSASGQSSAETTPTIGGNPSGAFGPPPAADLFDDPFRDQAFPAQFAGARGSRKQAPSTADAAMEPQAPGYVYQSPARKIRIPAATPAAIILPPTPAYVVPDSPRKRLAGPRPEPRSPASGSMFPLPRSNSVKDLIANLEQRASQADLAGIPALADKADTAPWRSKRVVHGLAKKPKLYVANPDAAD
ncbi:hypothetical protein JCM3774_002787 [Rhodotorula dairenensis]